jgi:hypothetical protein
MEESSQEPKEDNYDIVDPDSRWNEQQQPYLPANGWEFFQHHLNNVWQNRYYFLIFGIGIYAMYRQYYYIFSSALIGLFFWNYVWEKIIQVESVYVLVVDAFTTDSTGEKIPKSTPVWSLYAVPTTVWGDLKKRGSPFPNVTASGRPIYLAEGIGEDTVIFTDLPDYSIHRFIAGMFKIEELRDMLMGFIKLVRTSILDKELTVLVQSSKIINEFTTHITDHVTQMDREKETKKKPELKKLFDQLDKKYNPGFAGEEEAYGDVGKSETEV